MERLDKTVATFGNMPRSEAVRLIRAAQVRVDGGVCRDPAHKLDPAAHEVTVSGRAIDCRPHRYVMLNKPQGILCVSRDPKAPTVVDLLPSHLRRKGMFPAGRLDKDTVGLVLLTDDGDYAHRLLSPKKAVFKRYRAILDGPLPSQAASAFEKGLSLSDGTRCLPSKLTILTKRDFCESEESFCEFAHYYHLPAMEEYGYVEIAIQEGRYHQIKRMCEAFGHKVLWLKRLSIGDLTLDAALSEGECREMTAAEVALALQSVEVVCAK